MNRNNGRQNQLGETLSTTEAEIGRSAWAAALAGMALFLICGMELMLGEIPHDWAVPTWLPDLGRALFLTCLALPAIGLGIGWVKGFPRWSYPYAGAALLTSLFMMNVATPGLRVFSYTFGRNDLWGWRAWMPFLVMAVIALLITRLHAAVDSDQLR